MPKRTRRLDDRTVLAIRVPEGKPFVREMCASGYGLGVYVGRTRFWFFQYDHAGKRNQRIKLGDCGLVTWEEAKSEARRLARIVRVDKRDPKLAIFDPRVAVNLNAILDGHVSTLQESSRENLRTKLQPVREKFGHLTVRDFAALRPALKDLLERKWPSNPTTARLVARNLTAAFNKAMQPESGIDWPAGLANPARALAASLKFVVAWAPAVSRRIAFEEAEFETIFRALKLGYEDPETPDAAVLCLELILRTGARPNEIASLRVDEIRTVRGYPTHREIEKASHKTARKGHRRVITLDASATAVLEEALRLRSARYDSGPYVFPPVRPRRTMKRPYLTSWWRYCERLSRQVGMRFTPGQFRSAFINHTLDSCQAVRGDFKATLEMVSQNVGHSDVKVTLDHYLAAKPSAFHDAVRAAGEAFDRLKAAA